MSDNYQAVYDAVRSKIHGGDIGSAVESAIRDAQISFYADQAKATIQEAAWEYMRPSVIYRPKISKDGTQWCALYGENLHDGCAGFGDSISKAMADFDKNWAKPIEHPELVS